MKTAVVCVLVLGAVTLCVGSPVVVEEEDICQAWGFEKEGNEYVQKSSEPCSIMYCENGVFTGKACPLYQIPDDVCSEAKLYAEGCYYREVKREKEMYPDCCPKPKKFCRGKEGFKAKYLKEVVVPPNKNCNNQS